MKSATPSRRPTSKPARGGTLPDPLPGKELRRLAGSLKKQWRRHRKELKRCQKNISEKSIHASRVETRRLLAGTELLGGFVNAGQLRTVECLIKEHLDTFDELRDTQVQLLAVAKLLRQFPAARPFHDYLCKREARLAKKTRKRLRRISTGHLGKLIATLRGDIERGFARGTATEISAILLRSVTRAFDRTRRLRNEIVPRAPRTIHRTRVAFKKFRYMVETLAGHLPGVPDDYLEEMRHYQTMMGDIQDAEILLHALDRFLQKKQERQSATSDRFRAELYRRRQWLIRVYLDATGQLLDFWPLRPKATAAAHPRKESR